MNTGFRNLDKIVTLDEGKLIVLASRPAMGKSTFALNILDDIAIRQHLPVLYFNLESSKEQIMTKLIAKNSVVSYSEIKKEKINHSEWKKVQEGINIVSNAKIFVNDTPGISIDRICEKSRKMVKEKDIKFILIDYLQLISYKKSEMLSRDQEISKISFALKELANELNIPILIVSQLGQGPEKRKNHRPMIIDFRKSESIAQDADVVMFLYRDDYYNSESEERNVAEIIIAKNHNGECGSVKLATLLEYCIFANLEKEYK